jgi:hypothetical protein
MGWYTIIVIVAFCAGAILMARLLTGKWFVFKM